MKFFYKKIIFSIFFISLLQTLINNSESTDKGRYSSSHMNKNQINQEEEIYGN